MAEYPNWISLAIIALPSLILIRFSRSPRILNALPSFSTSIGVFFTFLVLWLNLSDEDMKIGNEEDVKDLVNELAAAFSTSIIGILGNIILSFVVKFRLDSIEKKNKWDQHPAAILTDNQRQISELTNSINSLASNLKTEFKDVFEELRKKIDQKLKDLHTKAQSMYVDEMGRITKTVVEKYSGDISKATTDLLKYLQEATATLEKAFSKLEKMQTRAGTALETSTERFETSVSDYNKLRVEAQSLLRESQKQSSEVTAMIENMQQLTETINQRSDGIQSMQQQLTDIGNVVEQLDRLKSSLTSITNKN